MKVLIKFGKKNETISDGLTGVNYKSDENGIVEIDIFKEGANTFLKRCINKGYKIIDIILNPEEGAIKSKKSENVKSPIQQKEKTLKSKKSEVKANE